MRPRVLAVVLFGMGACGDSTHDPKPLPAMGDSDSSESVEPGELHGPCTVAERLGGFVVSVLAPYSYVEGKIASGVVPAAVLDQVQQLGACTLWQRPSLTCTPPCNPQSTCNREHSCVPYPLTQNVGHVSVKGLAVPVEMEPLPPGNNYFATDVPHPLFSAGQPMRLDVAGGSGFAAYSLSADGVAVLTGLDDSWVMTAGQDVPVHWTPPPAGMRSRVALKVNIDQHGTSPMSVSCDFEDSGDAVIPSGLLDAMLAAGVSGFPSGSLSRYTADHGEVNAGCVDFMAQNRADVPVRVSGYVPCDSPDDCPEGLSCNLPMERCE